VQRLNGLMNQRIRTMEQDYQKAVDRVRHACRTQLSNAIADIKVKHEVSSLFHVYVSLCSYKAHTLSVLELLRT
jgi:hypothetical protein